MQISAHLYAHILLLPGECYELWSCLTTPCQEDIPSMRRWVMDMESPLMWSLARGTQVLKRNLPQLHFVHHKSHMMLPGAEPRSPWWETGASRRFYALLSPWRWRGRRHNPPKHRLTFTGLLGITSQQNRRTLHNNYCRHCKFYISNDLSKYIYFPAYPTFLFCNT
jgi:hypothetical protein